VVGHFGGSGQLANRPSEGWGYIDDEYNEARVAYFATDLTYTHSNGTTYTYDAGTASWWWLRSPGYSSYLAANVGNGGGVHGGGLGVDNVLGVRPALWTNL
jgi:hypothetical protein